MSLAKLIIEAHHTGGMELTRFRGHRVTAVMVMPQGFRRGVVFRIRRGRSDPTRSVVGGVVEGLEVVEHGELGLVPAGEPAAGLLVEQARTPRSRIRSRPGR
ncbi:MAG: hypothetical protein WKF82_13605 [Nocardioidaceae bacterium]